MERAIPAWEPASIRRFDRSVAGTLIVSMLSFQAAGCGSRRVDEPAAATAPATAPAAPGQSAPQSAASATAARLVRSFSGLGQISRVAVSPDGKKLLTLQLPETVRGWDIETGAVSTLDQAQVFPVLEIDSPAIGFAKDGRFLVVPARADDGFRGTGTVVDPCSLSPDAQWMLAIGRHGNAVDVYHVPTGRRVRGYVPGGQVTQAAFSHKGDLFFSTLASGEIVTSSLRTGLEVRRIAAQPDCQSLALLPDSDQALAVLPGDKCRFLDLRQGQAAAEVQIRRSGGQGESIVRVVPMARGKLLMAATSAGSHVIIDAKTGDEVLGLPGSPSPSEVPLGMGMSKVVGVPVISADGRRVAIIDAAGSSSVHVWELPDRGEFREAPSSVMPAMDLAVGAPLRAPGAGTAAATPFRKLRAAVTETPRSLIAVAIGRSGRRGWGLGTTVEADGASAVRCYPFDLSTGTTEPSFVLWNGIEGGGERLAVSPDERHLAAAMSGGTVAVIDVAKRQVVSRLSPGIVSPASAPPRSLMGSLQPAATTASVGSIVFSRDGKLIVVVRADAVAVHRLDTAELVRRISAPPQSPAIGAASRSFGPAVGGVPSPGLGMMGRPTAGSSYPDGAAPTSDGFLAAALSPDSEQLLAVTADGTLITYEIDTGVKLSQFRCQSPSAVAFSPDGTAVMMGCATPLSLGDGTQFVTAILYDTGTGSQTVQLSDTEADATVSGGFSDDGRFLLTGHSSGRVRRWATHSGQKIGFSSVSDVDRQPAGPMRGTAMPGLAPGPLPPGGIGGRPYGLSLPGSPMASGGAVTSVALLDDADQFWTVRDGGAMALWSSSPAPASSKAAETGTTITPRGLLPGAAGIQSVALSPDGSRSVGLTQAGDVVVWNLPSLELARKLKAASWQGPSSPPIFAADSKGVAYALGQRPVFLNLLNYSLSTPGDPSTGKLPGKSQKGTKKKKADDTIDLTLGFDAPAGIGADPFAPAPVTGPRILSLAFYPDGKYVLCGHQDGTLVRLDRSNGQTRLIDSRSRPILKVGVSRATQQLLSYDGDAVFVWEAATGKPVRQVDVPVEVPGRLEFSANGRRAAVWDETQREIVVLDLEQGTETRRIALSKAEAGQLPFAISADGRWLLAGSPSTLVTTMAPETGGTTGGPMLDIDEFTGKTAPGLPLGIPGSSAPSINRSPPDGAVRVIVQHFDPQAGAPEVKLWSLESGQLAAVLKGHTEAVIAVGLSADAGTAVTAGVDQTVRVWSLPQLQ